MLAEDLIKEYADIKKRSTRDYTQVNRPDKNHLFVRLKSEFRIPCLAVGDYVISKEDALDMAKFIETVFKES